MQGNGKCQGAPTVSAKSPKGLLKVQIQHVSPLPKVFFVFCFYCRGIQNCWHDLQVSFFLFLNKFIYLFIFGCVGSSLLRTGFLQLQRAGATLHCSAWTSHCGGFSCCGAQALGEQASVVVAHGLSSWRARAQLLHGMWDLPGPGLEPVSSVLAGGFLSTAPPGESLLTDFYTPNTSSFPKKFDLQPY